MFITPQAEFDQARFMGLRKRRISLYTGLQLVLFGLCWVIKCARRAAQAAHAAHAADAADAADAAHAAHAQPFRMRLPTPDPSPKAVTRSRYGGCL